MGAPPPASTPATYDAALYGKDPTPRIVSVHPLLNGDGPSAVRVYRRSADMQACLEEDEPFHPFFFLSDIALLQGFPRERFRFQLLAGDNFYRHLVVFPSWGAYWDAVRHVERAAVRQESQPQPLYLVGSPAQQYLMQTGRTSFKEMTFDDLHRLQLDIEVYTEAGFPNATRDGDEVIIVSLTDNRGWQQLLHRAPGVEVPGGVAFESEADLLRHLVRVIRERDPDVLETHNGLAFDFPYLMQRCERRGVPFAVGRDGSVPRTFPSSMRFAERTVEFPALEIPGRHVIDTYLLVMAYDVFKRDMRSYGLKAAARYFGFAPEGRTYVEGHEISRVWRDDPQRLLAYALDDAVETERLARQLSGSTFYLTQMLPMLYGQAARTGPAAKIEALFVREYLRQRHSLPQSTWGSQAVGGYTDVFFTGVAGPIVYADVESLYPSIMLHYDVRPKGDTLGLFPDLLRRLTDLRFEAKHGMKHAPTDELRGELDARQSSYKVLINCFDPETEVVTCNGIKRIADVAIGDLVYSINPTTLEVEIKPVIATQSQYYVGPMVEIRTAFVDYLVTPNHRFLTAKHTGGVYTEYEWETAADMVRDRIRRKLPPLVSLPGVQPPAAFISLADGSRYTTASTSLAEDFMRLGLHVGKRVYPAPHDGCYRLNVNDARGLAPSVKADQRRIVAYEGMIHCVTVADNHTLLCGRNGRFNWSGQSFYGQLGFSLALFNDFAEADRVAATGQEILRKIIAAIRREGGKVVEVDTDGVLFVPPPGVRGEEAEVGFIAKLNAEMPPGIRIGFDGRFRSMLSYKKKNYALLRYDGKMKFKGSSLVSRSNERFGRQFVRDAVRLLLDEDIQGLHDLYLTTREQILRHDWPQGVESFERTETIKDAVEQYLEDVAAGRRTRAAAYELAIAQAQATGRPVRKGDRIRYYITGTAPGVTAFENCRLADAWDPRAPDENTAYYLKRLDEFARKFEPFFTEHDYRLVFSPEDLFGFSPQGIRLQSTERSAQDVEDEVPF